MITVLLAAAALQAQIAATVDPGHRLIEGVASDGQSIWVSSVLDRAILECRETCRPLLTLPQGLHPLGLAWDQRRQRLWIAAECPKLPGIEPCERGALVGVARDGRILATIAPEAASFHPGDVSLSAGELFVSDGSNGAVYRLLPDGRSLAELVAPGIGKSAQGSALDADGRQLIVADYSQGIAAIDLASGTRTLLPRQDGKPLRGVDGLIRCGATYIGIYNGTAPGRLLTIQMRPGGVNYGELIENLQLPDPTQVAFDGKRLLIVPKAGWEAAAKAEGRRALPAPILAIPVGPDCEPT